MIKVSSGEKIVSTFTFKETEFIAVTAYQNEEVRKKVIHFIHVRDNFLKTFCVFIENGFCHRIYLIFFVNFKNFFFKKNFSLLLFLTLPGDFRLPKHLAQFLN